MIKLKSLIEAISPDKEEFEKAAQKSEYKIITIYMDNKGIVYIDDLKSNKSPVEFENTKAKLDLDYNNYRIRIWKYGVHGNQISPGIQQLLSILLKKGVVDSSWKVSFGDYEGWNRGYGDYVHRHGEYENLPPNFWKRNSRISIGENLKLYHGTSDLELPTILKYGLRPLGSKYTVGGSESRLRTEFNKNFLYLIGTFQDAFRFAKSKARSNMLRIDKEKYDYVQYYNWKDWFIKPVVLLITLPDFTKLRSDDDRIISMLKEKGRALWKSMDNKQREIEKIKTAEWFNKHGANYKPEQIEDYLWIISDYGFKPALELIDKSEWKNWKASLKLDNQVAYEGIIPPNYITVVDLGKVVSTKK